MKAQEIVHGYLEELGYLPSPTPFLMQANLKADHSLTKETYIKMYNQYYIL